MLVHSKGHLFKGASLLCLFGFAATPVLSAPAGQEFRVNPAVSAARIETFELQYKRTELRNLYLMVKERPSAGSRGDTRSCQIIYDTVSRRASTVPSNIGPAPFGSPVLAPCGQWVVDYSRSAVETGKDYIRLTVRAISTVDDGTVADLYLGAFEGASTHVGPVKAGTWTVSDHRGSAGTINQPVLFPGGAVQSAQAARVMASGLSTPSNAGLTAVNFPVECGNAPPSIEITSPTPKQNLSGTVEVRASASDNDGVAKVQFLLNGALLGPALLAAPYVLAWDTTTVLDGAYSLSVVATDTRGAQSTQSVEVSVVNSLAKIIWPIEVMGASGTTKKASFYLRDSFNTQLSYQLSLTIHGLDYPDKASVQLNQGPWISLNEQTAALEGLASKYGGIGGGFHTLKLLVPIPPGTLRRGGNTISFRFNGTDGVSSGFRVLRFNIVDPAGTKAIDESLFEEDDPNTWKPPLASSADIEAGRRLWKEAPLTVPGRGAIRAHCADCHTQDGRDLKYFNYSNYAIKTRAVFHGLTEQQGDQIASYIRSLAVINPGRPWNPPYQPGPGLDSKDVTLWAAGAGLEYVLERDADTLNYLMPNGPTDEVFSRFSNLSVRETPIALQLPDWNRWLPRIHPMDAWGSEFDNSDFKKYYDILREKLRWRDPVAYKSAKDFLSLWPFQYWTFVSPKMPPSGTPWDPAFVDKVYSSALWAMTKEWEVNQEFELEGMARDIFGPQADSRAWWGQWPFMTSPNMIHIPRGTPGLLNGKVQSHIYAALMWYELQLILNNSNKKQEGASPIDWPYAYGFIKELSAYAYRPQIALYLTWAIKAYQISENGLGPDAPDRKGWSPQINDVSLLVHPNWQWMWGEIPHDLRVKINEGLLRSWLDKVKTYQPSQFYKYWTSPDYIPVNHFDGSFGDKVWYMLPQFRYIGVDSKLLDEVTAWAAKVWPKANWELTKTSRCFVGDYSLVYCYR